MKEVLLHNPKPFSFYQVLRLLRYFCRARADDPTLPVEDRISVRPELSLGFPPSDIAAVRMKGPEEDPRFQVIATFLGYYGVSSPLPIGYTEDLMDWEEKEKAPRRFLDILNNRIYHLLFESWSKYRPLIKVAEEGNPRDLERYYAFLGLGLEQFHSQIPDSYGLLRYIGLFTQAPRSAVGLRTLLRDALGEPTIEVISCVQRRVKLPGDQRFSLGAGFGALGVDSFLGEEMEERMGMFRIRVGPLNQSDFRSFLPSSERYKKLAFLVKLYIREPLEYDLEVIIKRGETEMIKLGGDEKDRERKAGEEKAWGCLGVDAWAYSFQWLEEQRVYFHPQLNLHSAESSEMSGEHGKTESGDDHGQS